MLIGKINIQISKRENNLFPNAYFNFLQVCNGARCGSIDLWSAELIPKNQYRVTEMEGGKEKWLCIGQVLYEPLVMNLVDEGIYLFYQGFEKDIEAKYLGKLDDFLENYVFGAKYAELIPDVEDEEWYRFLKKIGIVRG